MRPFPLDIAAALFRMSIGVAFIGGFVTSVVGLLVPRLKLLLGLSYAQALLVQFAFHASYLLFALPVTAVIVRVGYMRATAAGLAIMATACVGLVAAQSALAFAGTLAALLLLSAGITFLQIASNTSITLIGSKVGAASRLTLLQGFNSVGTVLGPVLSAPLLLSGSGPGPAAPFLGSAIVLTALTTLFFARRDLLPRVIASSRTGRGRMRDVLAGPRLRFGATAIFAYVGAEVAIGSLLTNFLMLPDVLATTPADAGRAVSLYWAGAMVGRFGGSLVLRRGWAAPALAIAALAAAGLSLGATVLHGVVGAVALLSVGLFNSIMYPTIYALALPRDEHEAPLGSMLLCMAVVGGAVVPVATGFLADAMGLAAAFVLPALCYLGIAGFAWSCFSESRAVESGA